MEKDYRLFVKNLPLNIDDSKLEELFGKYAMIKKIDLKEKKSIDEKIQKFAFISITTTDRKLNNCFGDLNGERIDGFEISIELAKESFLERLKRERQENSLKKEKPAIPVNEDYIRPIVFNNTHSVVKSKHKKFDLDLSSNDHEIGGTIDTKKSNKETVDNDIVHLQENLNYQKVKPKEPSETNSFEKRKRKVFSGENSENISESWVEECTNVKNKSFNNSVDSSKLYLHKLKKAEITESEKKRLISLKQKKEAFKTQEQTIRNALRFVDKKPNKKIVFDDNDDDDKDVQSSKTENKKCLNNKNTLFDSEDEDQEHFQWNEDELDAKANLKEKLLKLQTNIGNDKRFVLDERFLDNEDKIEEKNQENTDISSDIDEKKWQLDILGNVLGKPITAPTPTNGVLKKKNKMIRYDPSASNHEDYEIKIEKSKEEKPSKKKKKTKITEVEEEVPIPKSSEIFYNVSENLKETLQESEGFSLLKAFGRDATNEDNETQQVNNETEQNNESFKFNFSARNPFKYDSSDDENDDKDEKATLKSDVQEVIVVPHQKNNRLFFVDNDPRFLEAEQFFKNQVVTEENVFKNRRRELKEIVRSKIRKNLKKTIPWNKKKVRKIPKMKR